MTEDRDFKNVVRKRAAKTGESYQAARRQVEHQPRLSAALNVLYAHPGGLVLGCVVEQGQIARGMPVTLMAGDTVVHQGTVVSLRIGKEDQDVVTSGNCGVMLDPPFLGYVTAQGEGSVQIPGALQPVEVGPRPDRVVG